MCTGVLIWGLQKPHRDINKLGYVGLCIGPTKGLSTDGNISLQKRVERIKKQVTWFVSIT